MFKPASTRSRVLEGQPFPLGATWDGLGVNFALFSAHATKVELCLFDEQGRREIERIELPEYRSEEHTSELQSLMRISYAVFCLKKNTPNNYKQHNTHSQAQRS